MARRLRRTRLVALAAVVGLGLTACGGSDIKDNDTASGDGGGSLGYIVVSGFSQTQLFGKGLAAGIAIAALGIMLDRIARYAAARYGR